MIDTITSRNRSRDEEREEPGMGKLKGCETILSLYSALGGPHRMHIGGI